MNPKLEEHFKELKEKADVAYSKEPSERSYKERLDIWYYENAFDTENYDEGEEVEIYDGKALANNEIKDPYDNSDFPDWYRELGSHFGEKVKIYADDTIYTLIGVSYTYSDLYYILQMENGSKVFSSCAERLEFV